jgi:hypothetical protein
VAAAGDIEPERVAIEGLRARDIADAQMHVANAQPVRRTRIGRAGRNLPQDTVDVERIGGDLQIAPGPFPSLRRAVVIDLDPVSFRVVEIECLAHRMVGCARECHLVPRDVQNPTREIAARRHEESGVIETRFALIVGRGVGATLEVNQGHGAGAERCALVRAVQHAEAEHVTVEAGHAFDLAHLEPDRADMERGAVGEGRDAGRVRSIHDSYIDASGRPRNSCLRTVGAAKAALL